MKKIKLMFRVIFNMVRFVGIWDNVITNEENVVSKDISYVMMH